MAHHVSTGPLFLDSTAGFIGKAPSCKADEEARSCAYLAAVVKPGAGRQVQPVSEMITASQDAVTIQT